MEYTIRIPQTAPRSGLWILKDPPGVLAQLPPTLRGVRDRGMKPRVEVAFQGWSVWGFGARLGIELAASFGTGVSAAASARAAAVSVSSFARQQCLYLRPDPQRQGSLRPGGGLAGAVIRTSVLQRRSPSATA